MNQMRLKPALKFQTWGITKAFITFFSIIIAITLINLLVYYLLLDLDGEVIGFNGAISGVYIMMFVCGIASIREDLKMLLQNGIGRRTTMVANLLTSLIFALAAAAFCELFTLLGLLNENFAPLTMQLDFYYLLFGQRAAALGGLAHLEAIVLRAALLILAWESGLFISLAYYRMEKFAKVAVSIAVPALLLFGLNWLFSSGPAVISDGLLNFFLRLSTSPWACISFSLVLTLIFGLASWLLLRRAPVRE